MCCSYGHIPLYAVSFLHHALVSTKFHISLFHILFLLFFVARVSLPFSLGLSLHSVSFYSFLHHPPPYTLSHFDYPSLTLRYHYLASTECHTALSNSPNFLFSFLLASSFISLLSYPSPADIYPQNGCFESVPAEGRLC